MSRPPRRRGIAEESDTPFAEFAEGPGRRAVRAYRCSVWALIPAAGLLLGPAAVVMGLFAWRGARGEESNRARSLARAAMILGGMILVTNWVGLLLMILGLRA